MIFSSTTYYRSNLGRFASSLDERADRIVNDAIERGADLSRALAPIGVKPDTRSIPLAASIFTERTSKTSGRWGSSARHGAAIEEGARPHLIVGNPHLRFYWEREGRMWEPGRFGEPDVVNHPGNHAQPYLEPAYRIVAQEISAIARKQFADVQ